MKTLVASALALSAVFFVSISSTSAQTRADVGGTIVSGVYDVSNATRPPAFCQVTVTPTATSLSALLSAAGCGPVPAWASAAYLTPESGAQIAIRYRSDGQAPTALVGQPVLGWQSWPVAGLGALSGAQLISATGAGVAVDVEIRG